MQEIELVKVNDDYIIYDSDIERVIADVCAEWGIEDLKKEGQRPWKGVLAVVGDRLFKNTNILKQKNNIYKDNTILDTNCNSYDHKKIYDLCVYYVDVLSSKYNKLPSIMAFSKLCGINETTMELWADAEPTSWSFKVWKKLRQEREDCLKDKNFDSNNVVGAISVGNTEYNWNMPGVRPNATGLIKGRTPEQIAAQYGASAKIEKLPDMPE